MTEEPEELTFTVPAARLVALLDAAHEVLMNANFFPPEEYQGAKMLVPTECVTALRNALDALAPTLSPPPPHKPELPS
jgi:hypothetical protein